MNELGIHSILRKKRHGKRGKTSHIAPNLLNRDFTATALNQKWVTDVTEFHVGQEKLYFSPLMDLANREIIAYNFSTRPKFSLVKKMLEQGLSRLKPCLLYTSPLKASNANKPAPIQIAISATLNTG